MAISTTSDLNSLYNGIYEDSLFVLREQSLMPSLVTGFMAQGYATRTVSIFSQSTAQTVAEGVDFSQAQTFSKSSKATFAPGEAMAQFILTDRMVQTDSVDGIQQAASNELGLSIAEKVDTDLLGLFDNLTAGKGSAGSSLTIGILGAANSALRANKVRGVVNGVLHPYQWHDIWTELGQPGANQAFLGEAANEAMREAYVQRMLAITWYISANISIDASDDAYGAIFTREAIALDEREAYSVRPQRDESLRAVELNGHMGYAVGVLRGEAGMYLLSDATEPTS